MSIQAISNTDSAFSFPVSSFLLIPLSLLTLIVLGITMQNITALYQRVGLTLIVSGGLSNVLERILVGGVTDIFHILTLSTNIADILIVTGGVVLLAGRLFALQTQPRYHS